MDTTFSGYMFNHFDQSNFSEDFCDSFSKLDKDIVDYNDTDFQSRFRHFSCFYFDGESVNECDELMTLFNHKKPFHSKYDTTKSNKLSKSSVLFFMDALPSIGNTLPINAKDFAIGVNQIRVTCCHNKPGATAPSFHQDGYDYSLHICVNRHNILNGTSIIADSDTGKNVKLKHTLQSGEYIFFNDRKLYHTATQILPLDECRDGFRDMIIIDFVKL